MVGAEKGEGDRGGGIGLGGEGTSVVTGEGRGGIGALAPLPSAVLYTGRHDAFRR